MEKIKKRKTYLIVITAIIIWLGLFVVIGVQLSIKKERNYNVEQLQKTYDELQLECNELKHKVDLQEKNNENIKIKIEEQRRTVAEGWQPFLGRWGAYVHYVSGEEIDKYAVAPGVNMTCEYIYIDGSFLTAEPVYDIAVRTKEDVLKELESVGIKTEDAVSLLPWECYIEMSFSESYNKDVIPKRLRRFVETAKYYIIDNDTMLCVSTSDGERLDILYRRTY